MKYTAVLNGCAPTFSSQAKEIGQFISAYLQGSPKGNSIIFYCAEEKKAELIANSPTPSLTLVKVDRYQPEQILKIIQQLEVNKNTELYLFPGDFAGSECPVRLAYRLGGSSLVAVNKIETGENQLTCCKAVYGGYLQGRFILHQKPYCLSIARGFSAELHLPLTTVQELTEINNTQAEESSFSDDYEFTEAADSGGLEQAEFILVAGRGVRNKEKAEQLKIIAREIGAEFGVSRPVAMSAWAPINQLVGVSGVITKPKVCITAGVSGAAAFLAGIEKSKLIIAINTDQKAPIVHFSDAAIIDHYEEVLDELVKILKHRTDTK